MTAKFARSLALSSLVTFAVSAHATTVTSPSYSAWLTTVTGTPTQLDFSGLQIGNSYPAGYSANPGPVVFTGPDGSGHTLSAYQYGGVTSLEGPTDGIGYINVAMPTGGENAFAMKLATTGGTALSVTFSDGETFTPAAGVFAFSISHDITWLQISTTTGSAAVVQWAYDGASNLTQDGSQQPTSEAATALLLGGGLLIVFGSQRKIRRNLLA